MHGISKRKHANRKGLQFRLFLCPFVCLLACMLVARRLVVCWQMLARRYIYIFFKFTFSPSGRLSAFVDSCPKWTTKHLLYREFLRIYGCYLGIWAAQGSGLAKSVTRHVVYETRRRNVALLAGSRDGPDIARTRESWGMNSWFSGFTDKMSHEFTNLWM